MKYTGQGKQNKPASWFLRFYDTTGAGEVTACLARVAKGSVELSKIIVEIHLAILYDTKSCWYRQEMIVLV